MEFRRPTCSGKVDRRRADVRETGGSGESCLVEDGVQKPSTQAVLQNNILEGVIAFIDARSNCENQFEGISRQMEILGASVVKKFTSDVTHVIFKDGKKSTIDKAQKKKIPVMSVLWVESCKQNGERVPEEAFPVISNKEANTPLFGRIRRAKCMQPRSFEEDVKNSAERGMRQRRIRKALAETQLTDTPTTGRILCEDTQDPCSPPQNQHMVEDMSCPYVPESPLPTKKLDFSDFLCEGSTEAPPPPGPTPPFAARTPGSATSGNSTSVRAKPRGTPTESPTCSPRNAPPATPRNLLLTDSAEARKGKRKLSTSRGRASEGTDDTNKKKRPRTVEGGVLLTVGARGTTANGANGRGRPGTKTRGEGPEDGALDAQGEKSILESRKKRNEPAAERERRDFVGTASDSGVSSGETDNEQLRETPHNVSGAPLGVRGSAVKYRRTAKLVKADGAAAEEEGLGEMLKGRSLSSATPFKARGRGGQKANQLTPGAAGRPGVASPRTADANTSSKQDSAPGERTSSNRGISLTRKKYLKNSDPLQHDKDSRCLGNTTQWPAVFSETEEGRDGLPRGEADTVDGKTAPRRVGADKLSEVQDPSDEGEDTAEGEGGSPVKADAANGKTAPRRVGADKLSEVQEPSDEGDETTEGESGSADDKAVAQNAKFTATKCYKKKPKPKRSIVMTSMHFGEQDIVVSVVRKLGGFCIADKVAPSTTHVVCGTARRTLNVLRIIAQGGWLVSPEWVLKSLEAGYWVDEEPYELSDDFPAAQLCRLERISAEGAFQPDLLASCGSIFLSQSTAPPPDALASLISLCGGKISTSLRKAEICVGIVSRKSRATNVSEQWVLDSITKHSALPLGDYILERSEVKGRPGSPTF